MEKTSYLVQGFYRDILKGPDGKIIYDSNWKRNTIMDSCRVLLARFMRFDPANGLEPSNGIQYLAVGKGLPEWDTEIPPVDPASPDPDLENRYSPEIPLANLTIVYLDEANSPSITPTNRLQITATLEAGYPAPVPPLSTYPLREFGFFGSFDGEEFMINCVRHPVIHKDAQSTLVRAVRLVF